MKKLKKCYFLLLIISFFSTFCMISFISYKIENNSESSSINYLPIEEDIEDEKENLSSLKMSAVSNAKNGYAIVVGISDYPGSSADLEYCDDDAQDIYSMLIEDYNFKSENIFLLQDSTATKSAINSAFDIISTQISPDDVFFFYYSGHGGFGTEEGPYYINIESPHNYTNRYDHSWDITHPYASYMRVHLSKIATLNYDYLYLGDSNLHNGYYYAKCAGHGIDIWSPWIPLLSDDTLVIRFFTSNRYVDWGFEIDQYEAILVDGTHYLCSYDSIPDYPDNYYIDSLLDWKLYAMNCVEKYVIMDTCHSGGMIPETQGVGRYIMSSSQDDEYSLEDSQRESGCFTYNFLESLDMATDLNGDGVISMEERYDYTYTETVARSNYLGYEYHPQEYDGISGEAVLETDFASYSLNQSGNQINYTFQLYGVGELLNISLAACIVNDTDIIYENFDLTEDIITNTGFELYSGTKNFSIISNLTNYGVIARIEGNRIITLENVVSDDYDNDTLGDLIELFIHSDPKDNDTDNDGLSDGVEHYGGTNPLLNDTDGDGLYDGDEVFIHYTNPSSTDTDDDGLKDEFEILILMTNATNSDTDGDLIFDGYEYNCGLNYTIDDASDDYDEDGLTNLLEFQIGSLANNNDTEGDLIPDEYEYYNELNLLEDDASDDTDRDGLTNLLEFQIGTLANNIDSDGDLMPDGYEYDNNLDYNLDDSYEDADLDKLVNFYEFLHETNPHDSDSDNDGLYDGEEVIHYQTNPLLNDTDGDGYSDGMEVEWGSDPNNPRNTIITIILNYASLVGLGIIGIFISIKVVSYKKIKKEKISKFKKNFKIQPNIDFYNILSSEKINKITTRPIHGQFWDYTTQNVERDQVKMKNHNLIKNKLNLIGCELKEPIQILFPRICLICGQTTDSTYQKMLYGRFTIDKLYKNNYTLLLPICTACQSKMNIKKRLLTLYGLVIVISFILGLTISGMMIFFFCSYILGFSIAALLLIVSIIYCYSKIMNAIELKDYTEIHLISEEKDKIILRFRNIEYLNLVKKIN
ncbi:MAG: caspase family protein [Candidatus Lokiarchaeota archaeon]|nr:caspase family protein [Candidatus Lokiarchaeota archaeon]